VPRGKSRPPAPGNRVPRLSAGLVADVNDGAGGHAKTGDKRDRVQKRLGDGHEGRHRRRHLHQCEEREKPYEVPTTGPYA